jgi:hypothetical protein
MTTERKEPETAASDPAKPRADESRPLRPVAERALAEAAARRLARDRHQPDRPREIQVCGTSANVHAAAASTAEIRNLPRIVELLMSFAR